MRRVTLLLTSVWLTACGERAAPAPTPEAAPAEAPEAPSPTASAEAPWRAVIHYGEEPSTATENPSKIDNFLGVSLNPQGVYRTRVFPPYGVVEVFDASRAVVGSLDVSKLAVGDHGWIFAEEGREPLVVTSLEVRGERPVVYDEAQDYFGLTVRYPLEDGEF